MRAGKFFAFALSFGLVVAAGVDGQPPNGPKGLKGPPGKGGPKGQGGSERLLDDLNVSGQQKAKARDILKAHDDAMRQFASQKRQELLAQMKDVLEADEFKKFQEEVERVPLISTAPNGPRGVAADEMIGHLMSFDKNADGKIAKDELPERMHALFEEGDANKDGVLDSEEIKRLAARAERAPNGPRGGPPGGGPPGNRPFPPPPPRPN